MSKRPPPHVDEDTATEIYDGPRGRSPVLKVISMKTPAEAAAEASQKTPEVPRPQLRPMQRRHPTAPSGNLAPPRTAAQPVARALLSPVALGAILAIAAGVGLAIWLLASR